MFYPKTLLLSMQGVLRAKEAIRRGHVYFIYSLNKLRRDARAAVQPELRLSRLDSAPAY